MLDAEIMCNDQRRGGGNLGGEISAAELGYAWARWCSLGLNTLSMSAVLLALRALAF